MTSKTEIWKPHPEYAGIEVSTLGKVRTLDRVVSCKGNGTRLVKGRVLKQSKDKDGYLLVNITINGKQTTKRVHRLIAQTFITNPNGFPMVNHKDCNRDNNKVSNIEWCTASYNSKYREELGEALGKSVFAINLLTFKVSHFISRAEASHVLGIHHQNINAVINGKQKQAKGYWFTNADDNVDGIIKCKLHEIKGDAKQWI